ncbi:MAG TPA: hypothetical protein VF670_13035, partial [Duganella sp.]
MQDVRYHFRFADGLSATCEVAADPGTAGDLPRWTALEFQQCPNCPLSPATSPHCPMAARLVPLVDIIGKLRSYEPIAVRVETAERTVSKVTTVQRGIGALMGLLVAGSAC